jgi:peptidyl-prolyl cis-trans isomerase C
MKKKLTLSVVLIFLVAEMCSVFAQEIDLNQDLVGNGDVNIPLAVFDAFLNRSPLDGQINLLRNNERLKEIVGRYYFDAMIADDARELGLDKDPIIKARLDSLMNQELTRIRKEVMAKEPVPDMSGLAKDYYKAHKEEFHREEQVWVAHIMIGYENHSTAEAKKIAQEIHQAVLDGEDFTELAMARSEDPSVKHNQGDLGWLQRTALVKPFADAAFALKKKGEISPVVQSKFGFHVIKFFDKKAAMLTPFEEIKEALILRKEQEYRENRWMEYVAKVRTEYEVGIDQKLLKAYQEQRLKKLLELKQAVKKPK